jgi:hypothetical protein
VVPPRAARLADLADDLVLGGRRRIRQVRQGRELAVQLGFDAAELLAERLRARRHLAHPGDRVVGRIPRAAGGGDRARRLVLLGLQALHLRDELAPAAVELEDGVQAPVIAAAGQGGPGRLGICAEEPEVEQGGPGPGRGLPVALLGAGGLVLSPPEYLARNSATAWASSPTTMFSGMIAPE